MVQIQPSLLIPESRDWGLETGEILNSNDLNISKCEYSIENNGDNSLKKLLFYAHKIHEDKFIDWLHSKKVSDGYILNIKNSLRSCLRLQFDDVNELRDKLVKGKCKKYRTLALRNFLNYCEEYEYLEIDLINKIRSKVKVTEKSNIDTYIPSKEEIKNFKNRVHKYNNIDYIFLKILLESGLRVTEGQEFVKNIDVSKFEIYDNVVVYSLYHLRGSKNAYYVFLSFDTYKLIIDNIKKLKVFNVEKLKTWIKRNKLIPLKYTRKYNFTMLIKANINLEVANFIQGRVSKNVGFNHYLAKKEVAVKEYKMLVFKKD
ncbi:MAG: integrase [Nanoarchaeota archaeon]|nr:integrase [Nanoarchaeota archaeon]